MCGGATVTLDASQSSDPEGAAVTYAWTQIGGQTQVTLSDPTAAMPSFGAPSPPVGGETLTFEVTVTDPEGASGTDAVDVAVVHVNEGPFADAGAAQTVSEGVFVQLDASLSYDPEGDALAFAWTQTGGPSVTLDGADGPVPSFDAPLVAAATALRFEVAVTDVPPSSSCGDAVTDTAFVTVTVENVNHAPTADAGADATVDEGQSVGLDGTGSADPDGDALTYAWLQLSGTPVTLSDPGAPAPTFTAPEQPNQTQETLVFRLTVEDGFGGIDSDEVTITVLDVNAPPDCSLAVPSRAWLWPPNHEMAPISIDNVSDPGGVVTIRVLSVHQDEPVDGGGDGSTAPDAVISPDGTALVLRVERSGGGNGRVYTIAFEATTTLAQGLGGTCNGAVQVCVPHHPRQECTGDGPLYDSTAPGQ